MLLDTLKIVAGETLYGVATVLYKKSSETHNYGVYLFWTNIVFALVFLPLFFLSPLPTLKALVYSIFLGLIYIVANYAYYKALSLADASAVASLTSFTSIVGFLLGILILGELFNSVRFFGVIVGVIGVLLVITERLDDIKKIEFMPPVVVFFCVVDMLCWGFGYVVMHFATHSGASAIQVATINCILLSLVGLLLMLKNKEKIVQKDIKIPAAAGAIANLGFLLIIWAVATVPASIAAGMGAFFIMVPFLYDVFIEKKAVPLHRFIGALLVVTGTVLVAL